MSRPRQCEGMSMIVKTVCGWLKGFILLYGIHIILYGHLSPGGGFAGGVVAASAYVLILLAEGQRKGQQIFSRQAASTWDSIGVLLFLAIAVLGIPLAGVFLGNFLSTPESRQFDLLSSGVIPVSNIGIGLKVCASLYLVSVVLSTARSIRRRKGGLA